MNDKSICYNSISHIWKSIRKVNGQVEHDLLKEIFVTFGNFKSYCLELLKKQEYKCAVSGIYLLNGSYDTMPANKKVFSMSINAIDPKLGHVKENIEWVCRFINVINREKSKTYHHKDDFPNAWTKELFQKYFFTETALERCIEEESSDSINHDTKMSSFDLYKKLELENSKKRKERDKLLAECESECRKKIKLLEEQNKLFDDEIKSLKEQLHVVSNKPRVVITGIKLTRGIIEPRYILKNNWLYIEARSYFFFTREPVQHISCTSESKHPVVMNPNNKCIHVQMRTCSGWYSFSKDIDVYFNDHMLYGMKIIESDLNGKSFKAATRSFLTSKDCFRNIF